METETSTNHIPANSVQGAVSGSVIFRPILFSTEMVKAILKGRKTQTRRIVKGVPLQWLVDSGFTTKYVASPENNLCPYGKVGDILWVRETWQFVEFGCEPEERGYVYKASENGQEWQDNDKEWKWKPSIFMPREACRIELRITDIKIERLQSISEGDAVREGIRSRVTGVPPYDMVYQVPDNSPNCYDTAKEAFSILWGKVNGRGSWQENPFVWVITFERTEMPVKTLPLTGCGLALVLMAQGCC